MADTIIKSLRDYFLQCPLMGGKKINVNYLPAECRKNGVEYSIDTTPATEIIKRYADGSTVRQYLFVIRSVADYGADILQNLANSGFYEELADWLAQQTQRELLPALPPGKQAQSIEAQSTGYLFTSQAGSGKYQIQCRLKYFQKEI